MLDGRSHGPKNDIPPAGWGPCRFAKLVIYNMFITLMTIVYDTYNELYLDGVIKQRSHHWVTEKPTIPWRTFANHWCGVTSFEHLPVLPRRAASTASPWPMPWPSVEQKPSFPHCAEAQRNCSLIVAWHGPTRPMISNDIQWSPWVTNVMEEWPDANCSKDGVPVVAMPHAFYFAAVSPAVAANCRGVDRTCGRESLGKPTIEINRIPRSGSLFWGAFTIMAVAIICL